MEKVQSLRDSARIMNSRNMFNFKAAEIGVSSGLNAISLLKNTNVGKLYLIDPYTAYIDNDICFYMNDDLITTWNQTQEQQDIKYYDMIKNITPYLDRVVVIRESSFGAARSFTDGYFDYIYIDGCHNEESVSLDISLWYPKVVKGGVFAGHDYPAYNGVRKAVDDFVQKNNLILFSSNGDWCIIKP